ncbi:MAG: hypothetical protein CVV23_15715 [Ignavibacteriae bacterium HGW-Ignavibacteriae-2]|nr:MAG: hypothetical protein CVV23_15715 [Ignavibacteriae bacterium HGW-Ignavibacteriae-2]
MLTRFRSILLLIIFFTAINLFTACGEDEKLTPPEEHIEAVHMSILDGTNVIYDFKSADYSDQETYSNDTIRIASGKSNLLLAKFFDENGIEINPEEETNTTFSAEFGDNLIASISWDAGEEGSYQFYFNGKTPGITTVTFFINHEGHPDFRTKINHIVVN